MMKIPVWAVTHCLDSFRSKRVLCGRVWYRASDNGPNSQRVTCKFCLAKLKRAKEAK